MKINYIVAFYFGKRRAYNPNNKLFFLEKQLKFVSSLTEESNIKQATFVVNFTEDITFEEVQEKVDSTQSIVPIKLFFRENTGISYSAWNKGLEKSLDQGFDYHFINEDDYLPAYPEFYVPFVNKIRDNIAYVCLVMGGYPRHPAVCMGIFTEESIKKISEQFDYILEYPRPSEGYVYEAAIYAQVHLVDHILAVGFDYDDVGLDYNKPFMHPGGDIENRGGEGPILFNPLREN